MRYPSLWRFVARAGIGALVVVWLALFWPVTLGGPASYQIVSGTSMEPGLHAGDLVVTRAESAYSIGDVAVYRVPAGQPAAGSLIVHRIVGGDAVSGFVFQGDNKDQPDPWMPKQADIVGRSWIELPGAGRLMAVVRSPLVLATILGGLAGLWFLASAPKTRPPAVVADRATLAWRDDRSGQWRDDRSVPRAAGS